MILIFDLIFILITPTILGYNFEADYNKLKKKTRCQRECYFDQPEMTRETMAKWPSKCTDVCAILTLNQNCDISAEELKTLFENMSYLNGGLRIENTSFRSLSFLPEIMFYCELFGTFIANNSQLETVDSLAHMEQNGQCFFRLSDNPKLNATALCDSDYYKDLLGLQIFGNKVDCGCMGGKMSSKTFEKFVECENVQGNLTVTDLNDPSTHLKLKKITGDLVVKNTNLTSLSFLGNLVEMKSKSHVNNKRIIINIHDNYQMTSLGLMSLKNLTNLDYGPFMMNFERLHPDFCITVDEMKTFLDYFAEFSHLEASYCKYNNTRMDGPKLCVFEKMSSLESDCEHILGEILIESGDEDYVDKLKIVTHVFGSITIRNTELENCKFLKRLERIASLNDTLPAMQFINNKQLEKLALPNIGYFVARVNRVIVEGNSPDIFEKTTECMTIQYNGQTNVTYNGGTCKAVNKTRVNSIIPYDDDYSDDSHYDWMKEYEGYFYNIDTSSDEYVKVYNTLNSVNDAIAVFGFVANIFHLIVLLQKELRSNFIYIMMIGICICDILLVLSFIVEFVLKSGWVYGRSNCELNSLPYFHAIIKILETPTKAMSNRCSSFLAFSMALFRTCSVMFPMSSTVSSFSKPKVALSLLIAFFSLCSVWDYSLLLDCKINVIEDYDCEFTDQTVYMPYCRLFYGSDTTDDEDEFETKWVKTINLVNGFSAVIIALLYIAITIVLLTQLKSAQKRRKSLKSDKSENTSLLVTVMAITFFFSGSLYGSMFLLDEFILKYFIELQNFKDGSKVITWTFLIINSTVHCLICFFMSSQYRDVGKRVFWRRQKESVTEQHSVVADMATISTVKSSKTSTKKTF